MLQASAQSPSGKTPTSEISPALEIPEYDPRACTIGLVHLGYGAFHRAHQAVYFDRYMEHTGDLRWGIAAVNLRAEDSRDFPRAHDAQAEQAEGYVLKTASSEGLHRYRLIRCHRKFVDWALEREAAEYVLADRAVTLGTMTLTEGAYSLDGAGNLDLQDSRIATELAGGTCTSVYGYLRGALAKRRRADAGPVTLLCCDNLRANGPLLRKAFLEYLTQIGDKASLEWVLDNVLFPASMVDRITPRLDRALSVQSERLFGQYSGSTVLGEDFIQWVIEDTFTQERPRLEKVGVTFTDNIDPYEEAKIRILNGGHTCVAYLGALQGHTHFDQVMADPDLFAHYQAYQSEEVLPALNTKLPFSKQAYLETITQRFHNTHITDALERICMDGYAKFPIFIAPTLRGCLKQGHMPLQGLRSIASWYVFARKALRGCSGVRYTDSNMDLLAPLLVDGKENDFVSSPALWGALPESYPGYQAHLLGLIRETEEQWQQ